MSGLFCRQGRAVSGLFCGRGRAGQGSEWALLRAGEGRVLSGGERLGARRGMQGQEVQLLLKKQAQ